MIEGRKVRQISKVFSHTHEGKRSGSMVIEFDHHVVKFKRYLPAGPLPGGAVRRQDLIQFYANPGGLRTVAAQDIIL
jgi:hypothetical protein